MSRRDEIVSNARTIFSSKGYRNTSMRDIADACGLLAGSLYSHFKSKSEILQLIIDPFYDQLIPAQEAAAGTKGTGAMRTEEMLRHTFRVLAACAEEMTIIHYDWQDLLDVAEFEEIRERSNYALELWHQVIVAGVEDGTLRSEIDPELTVRVFTSSLHGVIDPKRYGARPKLISGDHFDKLVDEFVLLMLSGLCADGVTPRGPTGAHAKGPKAAKSAKVPSVAASTKPSKTAKSTKVAKSTKAARSTTSTTGANAGRASPSRTK